MRRPDFGSLVDTALHPVYSWREWRSPSDEIEERLSSYDMDVYTPGVEEFRVDPMLEETDHDDDEKKAEAEDDSSGFLPSWSPTFVGAAAVAFLSFIVSFKMAAIGDGVTGAFTDGRELLKPGQTLHEHAYAGMAMAAICFSAILTGAHMAKRRSNMTLITTVFAVIALSGAVVAFTTFQQYRDMLN